MKPLAFERRLLLIFVFAVARLIDLATTAIGISIGKAELNPLVHAFGIVSLYVFDLVLVISFVLAAWKVKTIAIDLFLVSFAILVSMGAAWNLFVLL